MNPFDFVKNVNKGKSGENLFQNETADNNEGQNDVESFSKNYTPFIINRALSYFPDSALFANGYLLWSSRCLNPGCNRILPAK